MDGEEKKMKKFYSRLFEPGTLVTVMLNGFWDDRLLDGAFIGPLAGVTETDGGICVFFADNDDDNSGSGNVFCSLAADNPRTISSNFRRRFSLPPVDGSSIGGGCYKIKIKKK